MKLLRLFWPWCWPREHVWRITRRVRLANLHLAHLHPYAGCDAVCERCGAEWRDFENFARRPWFDDNGQLDGPPGASAEEEWRAERYWLTAPIAEVDAELRRLGLDPAKRRASP